MTKDELLIGLARIEAKEKDQARKDAEDRKNRDFVQLNITYGIPALFQAIRANPLSVQLLLIFMGKMDGTNAVACSSHELQKITGKSRQAIYKATKWLADNQYLKITKLGNMNCYHLSPRIIWKSRANAKKQAMMKGAPNIKPESLAIIRATKAKKTPVITFDSP